MSKRSENVAILGASASAERFSYKAMKLLEKYGHRIFLVHPSLKQIEGLQVYKSLSEIPEKMDTVTVYVGPHHQSSLISQIITKSPARVILNPGTEGEPLKTALEKAKISYIEDCTLVMLNSGRF